MTTQEKLKEISDNYKTLPAITKIKILSKMHELVSIRGVINIQQDHKLVFAEMDAAEIDAFYTEYLKVK